MKGIAENPKTTIRGLGKAAEGRLITEVSALVVNYRSACYLNVWKMMIVGRMSAVVYLMVGALLGWTASME